MKGESLRVAIKGLENKYDVIKREKNLYASRTYGKVGCFFVVGLVFVCLGFIAYSALKVFYT